MTESPITIRPMTLAEILDRAIRLYRQNFLKFVGIIAIPYIPLVLVQIVLAVVSTTQLLQSTNDPSAFPFSPLALSAMAGSFIVVIIQFILVQGIATAALTRAVADNYTGKPIGIVDAYRNLSTAGIKLVLALILAILAVIVLLIWSIIPIVGWFSGPGILFFFSIVVMPLIAPVIALENVDVISAIRRAWDLGRSRFWWMIGYTVVLGLLGQLIVTGPVYLISFVLQIILTSMGELSLEFQTAITSILPNIVTLGMNLLYLPLQLTMMTVVYFDLRARLEGLDLALQLTNAEQTEMVDRSLPEISGQSTMPLITGIDIGRFALLSLLGVLVIGAFYAVIFALMAVIMAGAGL